MHEATKRDKELLPITRMILNDLIIHVEVITYAEFAKRATRLSIDHSVLPIQVGRMLDYYAATLKEGEEDLAHLVVNAHTGDVGRGYYRRGQSFGPRKLLKKLA